jgi:hypothetical protein
MNRRCSTAAHLVLVLIALTVALRADGRPWIDMGPKDDFAFDQPAATFELFEQLAGGGKGASLGPSDGGLFFITNSFFLDTGAGSIIAINDAESELQDHGYVTENTVLEQGVAGFSLLDVSADYYVEITDSTGSAVALPHTRIMSGQFEDLFGVNGVVGMPAMVGRVVTLDTSVWADVEDIFDLVPMEVRITNSLPTSGGHRYSVPIEAALFGLEGDDPLPNVSPIPMVNMSVGYGNANASGSFILDTGAAISFISSELGKAIGLDSNNDGVLDTSDEQSDGTLPIGGIGGTIEAPLFYIDRFTVPTEQGVDLVWNLEGSLAVAIVDIHPEIDGVLGSDLLTSGWFTFDLEGDGDQLSTPGPLQQSHFDFRQFFDEGDPGKIYFDLTPEFDVQQPGGIPGDFNRDGIVDARDYTIWRNSLGASGSNLPADADGDGAVDSDDYAIWKLHYGEDSGSVIPPVETPGDFNHDGSVNAADYTVWRNSFDASGSNLTADADGSGSVDAGDYAIWKMHFGESFGGGFSGSAAVPEPGGLGLTLLALAAIVSTNRRQPLAV